MSKTMFEEALDYSVNKNVHGKMEGARVTIDYTLSLEMAKHFAMMENTPRGYEVTLVVSLNTFCTITLD